MKRHTHNTPKTNHKHSYSQILSTRSHSNRKSPDAKLPSDPSLILVDTPLSPTITPYKLPTQPYSTEDSNEISSPLLSNRQNIRQPILRTEKRKSSIELIHKQVMELIRISRDFSKTSGKLIDQSDVYKNKNFTELISDYKNKRLNLERCVQQLERGLAGSTQGLISSREKSIDKKDIGKMDIEELAKEVWRLRDEDRLREKVYEKLICEVDVLRGENILLTSECKRYRYERDVHEREAVSLSELLDAAENDVEMMYKGFEEKAGLIRKIVRNAFKGIEEFKAVNEKGQGRWYGKVREMGKCLEEIFSQEEDQQMEKPNFRRSHIDGTKKHQNSSSSPCPDKEKQISLLSAALNRTQKQLAESDRRRSELQEALTHRQTESRKHIRAIELALDRMLDKLEIEFAAEEERIGRILEEELYLNGKNHRDDEVKEGLGEIGATLKGCLELIAKARSNAIELAVGGKEVREWLERENSLLREGLAMAAEKLKTINIESEELRKTLESSLKNFEIIINEIEVSNGGKTLDQKVGKGLKTVEKSLKDVSLKLKALLRSKDEIKEEDGEEGDGCVGGVLQALDEMSKMGDKVAKGHAQVKQLLKEFWKEAGDLSDRRELVE